MTLGFTTKTRSGDETLFVEKIIAGSKIHSIRSGSRWRTGMSIQMVIGNRTKARSVFNAGRVDLQECKGVQEIRISRSTGGSGIDYRVTVDGKVLTASQAKELALNDGFDSLYDFLGFFPDGEFTGQIVHWTDKKY